MIRRLAALYPQWWRARYGSEFDALLEDQRLTPFVLFDLLFGALDAHLTGDKGVSSMVSRWRTPAGLALTVGGLLWFADMAMWRWPATSFLPGNSVGYPLNFWVSILPEACGELLVAFGILGLAMAAQRPVLLTIGSVVALSVLLDAANEIAFLVSLLHPATHTLLADPDGSVIGDLTPGSSLERQVWWCASIAFTAGLFAQPVFAAIAAIRKVLPWPPLALLAIVSFVSVWQGYLTEPLWRPLPLLPALFYSVPWEVFALFRLLLPLCWLLVGLASLASRPKRVEIALP